MTDSSAETSRQDPMETEDDSFWSRFLYRKKRSSFVLPMSDQSVAPSEYQPWEGYRLPEEMIKDI